MRLTFPYPCSQLALAMLAAFIIGACHGPSLGGEFPPPVQVFGSPSQSFTIGVGQELIIEMGGVGPSYVSPPTLSGSPLEFIGENPMTGFFTDVAPQLFHFRGIVRGQAIILFRAQGIGTTPDIADTVIVR